MLQINSEEKAQSEAHSEAHKQATYIKKSQKNFKEKNICSSGSAESGQSNVAEFPPGWDEFYQLYPLKKAKKAGLKAYVKALKTATPEELIAGLQRFVAWMQSEQLKKRSNPSHFVPDYPLPASWLNAGRWDDECENPKPSNPNRRVGV